MAAVLEPQRPAPEAFGLTTDRLARFEHGRDRLYVRLFWVVFVLSFCLSMFEVFPKSFPTDLFTIGSLFALLFALLLFAFIEFAMSFLVAGIVTFGLVRILEAAWKRTQPDYGRFRSYERAVAQYKTEYATWLKTQRSWWDRLHPQRFEQEAAEFFKKQGHQVVWTGRSGDGGVDIRLTAQDGKRIVVQCKAHGKPVSPAAVRDLYGTLLHEKSDEAWLMSRSGFTAGATRFAAGKAIKLLSLDHILPARRP